MRKPKEISPVLHSALNLDGSPKSIKAFYGEWAKNYDRDTAELNYTAVNNTVNLLEHLPDSPLIELDPGDKTIKIMDAGCGTGLLAKKLQQHSYSRIDGFDISRDMVKIAEKTGCYKQLSSDIDINQSIQENWKNAYDCTICIGVFTPGHVAPGALSQLAEMTRPGGLVIVSTRVAYYESENYQQASDQLESAGVLKSIQVIKNASYTSDSKAHYWAYAVLTS